MSGFGAIWETIMVLAIVHILLKTIMLRFTLILGNEIGSPTQIKN